jgi:hypothetical protein
VIETRLIHYVFVYYESIKFYMSHTHWVARQNKLETPKEKDEVNKREVHESDVRTHDPDVMVVPPTPKPTFKPESLVRAPPTITSSCEENTALKK